MGRFSRNMHEEYAKQQSGEYNYDESYNAAYKKVKKIKGFYSHLKAYLIVNVMIVLSSIIRGNIISDGVDFSGLSHWHTYSTAFFWGIGLAIHAFSVFGPNLFFSDDWEQKKIQKYMEKEAANKNKWE